MRRELRDPLERCEHPDPFGAFEWNGFWHCRHDGCPGGKLVVVEDALVGDLNDDGKASAWVWVEVTPSGD